MLAVIAAMDENGVIGVKNSLPWRMAADLKWFRQITKGHTVIMGRRTFESIGKPLPDRENIVITKHRQSVASFHEVRVYDDLISAVNEGYLNASLDKKVFIIGGAQVYAQAMDAHGDSRVYSIIEKLYLTRIEARFQNGDAFFPKIEWSHWKLVDEKRHLADDKNQYDCVFQIYEKN